MITRIFSPGSEWLYLKIYCGVKTADIILQETIIHLVSQLKKKNLVKKWFFIRYNDPKPHIRLRFQLSDIQDYGKILEISNSDLKVFVDSGEIANILIDSYVRELERYGIETIETAEDFFNKSSELVMGFLNYDDEDKIIVSMFYIEQMFSELKLPITEKHDWVRESNNSFKREFNADKRLNNQLNKKFMKFETKYHAFFDSDEFEETRNLIIENISETKSALKKIREYHSNFLLSFFSDIFHMHINRTFISNQRLFEMIVYDYLLRHNKILSE
ncbi:thiopeptide-type bacteriocin biosynthesis protein [Chryseobacterium gambrini]|uniref:thiopeptide-type bacteriocin biosynthesis protein n=1 Tax=Chryseobacterium gambrini TaxID=373672 RepID=UPI0025B2E0C6|nr:thiopeptide-type bacteriocin biosynthesis protein [Chryseobacterium gambrini]MDN4028705.1 thiopeptide-type bacteriocin biosynthesis protein [Chryseobacterium gambrini]